MASPIASVLLYRFPSVRTVRFRESFYYVVRAQSRVSRYALATSYASSSHCYLAFFYLRKGIYSGVLSYLQVYRTCVVGFCDALRVLKELCQVLQVLSASFYLGRLISATYECVYSQRRSERYYSRRG